MTSEAFEAFLSCLEPPVPWASFTEEENQDWSTASRVVQSLVPVGSVRPFKVDEAPSAARALDGAPRTVLFAWFPVQVGKQCLMVPVHRICLATGILAREDVWWEPGSMVTADVYLFPAELVRRATGRELDWLPEENRLVTSEPIYERLKSGDFLWTDPLRTLEGDHDVRADDTGRKLEVADLLRTGWLREKAYDRGRELLRVLELGLLFEVHSADPEKVTLVDGPLAPLFKYAGMVNVQLKEWVEDPSREDARKFFSNIVGNVKNVVLTPVVHALDIMAAPTRDEVPVYHYPNTVHDRDDGLAREVGRVYLRLRPELPPPPVAVHELSAVDVVIGPPNATRSMSEVEALVACVFKERWPIPAVEGQRRYTELLPIAEAERWLRAGLPPVQEMQLAAR